MKGHLKNGCWILHPRLKPKRFRPRSEDAAIFVSVGDDLVRRPDLEAILGKAFFAPKASMPIIFYSRASSHHMISDANLISNLNPILEILSLQMDKVFQ